MRKRTATKAITRLLLASTALVAYASAAYADPTIDGVVTASDGYTTATPVNFNIGPSNTPGGNGTLYTFVDHATNTLFFGFVQNIGINNNAYGTNATSHFNSSPESTAASTCRGERPAVAAD